MKLFDLTKVQDSEERSFEVMPAGIYDLIVTNATLNPTNSGDGKYIKAEFTILSGEYKKRKVWMNFNIENPSQKAVDFGLKQLKDLALSAGKNPSHVDDLETMMGLEVRAMIKITESEKYGKKNEINYFVIPNRSEVTSKRQPKFDTNDSIPF